MLELYCELLLARAGVLDQIAFSERGVKARAKAKAVESARVRAKAAKAAGRGGRGGPAGGNVRGGGSGGAGGGGLGWFRGSSKAGAAGAAPETGSPASEGSAAGGNNNNVTNEDMQKQGDDPDFASDSDEEEEEDCYLDPGLDEAAAAIFYAVPRFPREVRELGNLRILLMERWGKDFASLATDNKGQIKVPERLVKSLKVKSPDKELVENYLKEIAKAYKIDWPGKSGQDEEDEDLGAAPSLPGAPSGGVDDDNNDNTKDDGDGGGGGGDNGIPSVPKTLQDPKKGKSPANEPAPPPPATNKQEPSNNNNPPATTVDGRVIPEVDELARRFAALKR